MISKNQSISVRLSQEDYAYLMQIQQNGAVTQSDKVRELIAMAREAVGTESFARSFLSATEAVAPVRARYKNTPDNRSAVIDSVLDLLAESAALVQAQPVEAGAAQLEAQLLPVTLDFIRRLLPMLLSQTGGSLADAENVRAGAGSLRAELEQLLAIQPKE